MENNQHVIPEDKLSQKEAVSSKQIGYYFLTGALTSIITFFVFGDNQNTARFVKNFSYLYMMLEIAAMYTYRKCIGIEYFGHLIRKKDLKIIMVLTSILFFVMGHMLGFFGISLIKNLF